MDSAFQYVRDKGLNYGRDYPYTAVTSGCRNDNGPKKIASFTQVPGCTNLENSLNQRPVSVAVDASNWSPYRSGVFNNCATNVNHGVLAVGYNGDYWKIKNSWGTGWGESGFIRLARGNTCAVCNYASFPAL